jgi:hypothetical protein
MSGQFNPMANGNRDYPSESSAVWESAVELGVVAESESGSDRFLGGASCLNRLGKNYCGTVEIQRSVRLGQQENTAQDAQKGRPLRPSFVKRRSSLVADPDAKFLRDTLHASRVLRTPLADFFSILLSCRGAGASHEKDGGQSSKSNAGRGSGRIRPWPWEQ